LKLDNRQGRSMKSLTGFEQVQWLIKKYTNLVFIRVVTRHLT
jgi:hypothetical protein